MNESLNDIIRVANIDVSCSLNDFEVHPNGQESFVAYYGKNPYPVEVGKTRLLPRFIAEHFAKHQIDHILTAQEKPISNNKDRAMLLKQILLGTEESYSGGEEPTEDQKVAAEVAKLEQPEETVTTEPAVVPIAEEPQEVSETEQRPTLRDLKEEADKLGIPYKKNVTVDQLLNLIKAF